MSYGWDKLGNGEVNLMEQMLEEGASIWNVWYKMVQICVTESLFLLNAIDDDTINQ